MSFPYLVFGKTPVVNPSKYVTEGDFWTEVEETIGLEEFARRKGEIEQHLLKDEGNFIRYGDLIFSIEKQPA